MTIKITIELKETGYYLICMRVDDVPRMQMCVDVLESRPSGTIYGLSRTGRLITIICPSDYDEIEYHL